MTTTSVEPIRQRLAARQPRRVWRWLAPRQAAVAIVLRSPGPRVLLVVRAKRRGDPWSGHVSLPGGMRAAGDDSLVDTALRETREEVGLRLHSAQCLGQLGERRTVTHSRRRAMAVSPFVFALAQPKRLELGDEVRDTFWLPLDRTAAEELDSWMVWRPRGIPVPLPCWRYQGHIIWGMTHRILRELLRVAG